MDRRRFLAAAGVGASTALTGCSLPTGPVSLGAPERIVDDGGTEYVYDYDDGQPTHVQYVVDLERYTGSGPLTVTLVLTAFEALVHDRFRFVVDAPLAGRNVPAEISVVPPPWPALTVATGPNLETVVSAGDFEHATGGTLQLPLELHPRGHGFEHVRVTVEARFRDEGLLSQTYRIDESEIYDVPTE